MKLIRLTIANIKLFLSDKKNFALMLLLPGLIAVASLIINIYLSNDEDVSNKKPRPTHSYVHFVDGIKPTGKALELSDNLGIVTTNKIYLEKNFVDLKNMEKAAIFDIDPKFNEKLDKGQWPDVKAYLVKESTASIKGKEVINNFILSDLKNRIYSKFEKIPDSLKESKNLVEVQIVSKTGKNEVPQFLTLITIMYLLSMLISPISKMLIDLRKGQIYERLSTTSNSGFSILLSQFLALTLIQASTYSIALMALNKVVNFGFNNFLSVLLFTYLFTAINISLAVLVTRITLNEDIGPSVGVLFAMGEFILMIGTVMPNKDQVTSSIIDALNKLNPMYWTYYGIRNSEIFPNAIILLLIIGIFLSAGSYRFIKLAKE